MKLHRSCHLVLGTALGIVAPFVLAGEIVLFDGENFQGTGITYRDAMRNLGSTGFNDRAGSIRVLDGTWEVCVGADFRGGCIQLVPGDYRRLDSPFNRSISSLREIGPAEYGGNYPAPGAAANEITLFEGENFSGDRMAFDDTVSNLGGTGFNDRAASISVRGGDWEVCFDADFRGGCMQLRPGDYSRLDPPFNRSVSSLRPLGSPGYGGNYAVPESQGSFGLEQPGVSLGINLPAYPELVPVPGYPVYYAPQVNSNYFFYDGMYWVYQQDSWYASSWYNGPWNAVARDTVPLYMLRVPVRYYRQPPTYFRGWRADAPPRWGERWGNSWEQGHRGWDNWNRNAAPPPRAVAFLPEAVLRESISGRAAAAGLAQRELSLPATRPRRSAALPDAAGSRAGLARAATAARRRCSALRCAAAGAAARRRRARWRWKRGSGPRRTADGSECRTLMPE